MKNNQNDDQLINDLEDDKKHQQAADSSVASRDTADALGSASEAETMDIDEERKAFGEQNDDNGPKELTAMED